MDANVEAKAGGQVNTKMGVISDTTKVDAIVDAKKDVNMDEKQDAKVDEKMDAKVGEKMDAKVDAKMAKTK